jgi:prepilin-type N-terminal cleavage/methylation domain-containing protein
MIDNRRSGLTLVELVVVIIIAGIMMGVAVPSMQRSRATRVARNARDVLVWNASRARARAIQTGNTYLYQINPATERAWIVRRNPTVASDTLLTINFSTEYEATLSTSDNAVITLCYNPRGYAFSCDVTSPSSNVDVTFTHATYTSIARVKPLGQIERL